MTFLITWNCLVQILLRVDFYFTLKPIVQKVWFQILNKIMSRGFSTVWKYYQQKICTNPNWHGMGQSGRYFCLFVCYLFFFSVFLFVFVLNFFFFLWFVAFILVKPLLLFVFDVSTVFVTFCKGLNEVLTK